MMIMLVLELPKFPLWTAIVVTCSILQHNVQDVQFSIHPRLKSGIMPSHYIMGATRECACFHASFQANKIFSPQS